MDSDNPEEITNLLYSKGYKLFQGILEDDSKRQLSDIIMKAVKPKRLLSVIASNMGVTEKDVMDKIPMINTSRTILSAKNKNEITELYLEYKAPDLGPMELYSMLKDSYNPIDVSDVVGKERVIDAIKYGGKGDNKIAGFLLGSSRPYDLAKIIGFDLVKSELEKLSNGQRRILFDRDKSGVYISRLFNELDLTVD